MLVILHSGQTGVERGAHRAAITHGLAITGFMPVDRRDELGPIPVDIADRLTPCVERGPRQAVRANITLASGVLLLVPEAAQPTKFTAIASVMQAVRTARAATMTVDPLTNLDDIVQWVRRLPETSGSVRVFVTGMRATRWADGETLARRVVGAIAMSD